MNMSEKPNFLIIMSDQHAPDTIGALGHPAVQTSALDQLISAGVSFRNAYCCYPMCTPSRASFMTGGAYTVDGGMTATIDGGMSGGGDADGEAFQGLMEGLRGED